MATSKNRLLWSELPAHVRTAVERTVGGRAIEAQNCTGGFSPGLASRLTLAGGRRVFVKAIDADSWPANATMHRTEAVVAAALPATVPAPRLIGSFDDGRWVALAFEYVDGAEPRRPWDPAELDRVVAAIGQLASAVTPSPVELPRDHPRLGGWVELAHDPSRFAGLSACFAWAASNIAELVRLEERGLAAAKGPSLVHCDLYPHNILLTPERVVFVDWPHARLGVPAVDVVTVMSSAAADHVDPEPIMRSHPIAADLEAATIDAILAAHAGFLMAGALAPSPPGLEPITEAKLHLGLGSVDWLRRRLSRRT